jgi:hypothetical protein
VLIRKRSGGPASDRFGRLADPPWYALLSFAAERQAAGVLPLGRGRVHGAMQLTTF